MKRNLVLGAILALLLALTSVSLASAGGDPKGDKNGDKVRVLQVTLTNSQETQLDLGDRGPSLGFSCGCGGGRLGGCRMGVSGVLGGVGWRLALPCRLRDGWGGWRAARRDPCRSG
jgi:hypothetical protein